MFYGLISQLGTTRHLIVLSILYLWITITVEALTTEEYCAGDKFQPKCGTGMIVEIKQARYGRMNIGRCVKTNFGRVYQILSILI